MERARRKRAFRAGAEMLERRETPSTTVGTMAIANATPSPIRPASDFHHPYLTTLRIRIANATQAAARVSQAFQLFEQNALGIPVKLNGLPQAGTGTGIPESVRFRELNGGAVVPVVNAPAGTVPTPDTYPTLFYQLAAFTDSAVTTFVNRTYRVYPSVKASPTYSPLAAQILVPYANAQIARAEQIFLANPPQFSQTTGKLLNPEPQKAVEAAFNSILYAVGEYEVHPNLFVRPTDFYVDPSYTFAIPYTKDPAVVIPDVYARGPGGVYLPPYNR